MESSISTKGQVSTIDFIVGFLILVFALLMATNGLISFGEKTQFEPVKRQAFLTSEHLMGQGTPENWNQSTVITPGILSENGLNTTKYELLQNISYQDTKFSLAGPYDWYAYLTNTTHILNISGCGIGYSLSTDANCQVTYPQATNRASVTRLLAHNGSIIQLVVVVWR